MAFLFPPRKMYRRPLGRDSSNLGRTILSVRIRKTCSLETNQRANHERCSTDLSVCCLLTDILLSSLRSFPSDVWSRSTPSLPSRLCCLGLTVYSSRLKSFNSRLHSLFRGMMRYEGVLGTDGTVGWWHPKSLAKGWRLS